MCRRFGRWNELHRKDTLFWLGGLAVLGFPDFVKR
jgi:hypothetical protein